MTAMELRLALRRGETLLASVMLPAVVLAFFSSVSFLSVPGRPVDFLLPGSIAFAIVAASFVSLGITTAYDRHYGVLKRLGGSPLSRPELIAAKLGAVLLVEAGQIALLVAVASLGLGWTAAPNVSLIGIAIAVVFGTFAFAGLGLLLAGILRAEAMLAVANTLFIASLVLGGVVVPVDHLPDGLDVIAPLLPPAAMTEALRIAFGAGGDAGPPLVVLAAWALASIALAVRTFRWD